MTKSQEKKIKALIDKYNDILLISMRLAVTEDFVNLILLNRDDREFELKDLMADKQAFYNLVMKEFLKKNSSVVVHELKEMEDPLPQFRKNKKLQDKENK